MRLIDPPVTPVSPAEKIRDWIATLERELSNAPADDIPDIESALEQARRWLRIREDIDREHRSQ